MKLLVDENIPKLTVHALRALGHDVLDLRGTEQQGMFDDVLWQFAQTEHRMRVTTDKGFAEHRAEQRCGDTPPVSAPCVSAPDAPAIGLHGCLRAYPALHQTRRERRGCNPLFPYAGSLNLRRSAHPHI